jgi:hypothetical protein
MKLSRQEDKVQEWEGYCYFGKSRLTDNVFMEDVEEIEALNASIVVIYVVIVSVTRRLIKGHGANVLKWKGYE